MADDKNPYAVIEQNAASRGIGRSADVVMPRTQASTRASNVSAATGAAKLPFAGTEAEGRARQAQAAGTAGGLKVEKARGDIKTAAAKELDEARDIIAATNRVLANPTFPSIVGRTFNPAYGMFGHYDIEKDSPVSGKPRLFWGGTQGADLVTDIDFLQKKAAMSGRAALRPDPQIGQQEQRMAGAAQANLDWTQSPVAWAKNAISFRNRAMERANRLLAVQQEERRRAIKEGLLPPEEDESGFKILSVKPVK
jgi:hypothetical protein